MCRRCSRWFRLAWASRLPDDAAAGEIELDVGFEADSEAEVGSGWEEASVPPPAAATASIARLMAGVSTVLPSPVAPYAADIVEDALGGARLGGGGLGDLGVGEGDVANGGGEGGGRELDEIAT